VPVARAGPASATRHQQEPQPDSHQLEATPEQAPQSPAPIPPVQCAEPQPAASAQQVGVF